MLIALWLSLLATMLAGSGCYVLTDAPLPSVSGFNIVGNVTFALALALIVWRSRHIRVLSLWAVAGIALFIISCVALIFTGALLFATARTLALLLISPVGAIGAYPAGPDVPFSSGAVGWAETTLLPIATGLLLATILRRLANARFAGSAARS